jgi:citrate lyase subunit beta/citryl-CoA lyase
VIDGPYLKVHDLDGLREYCRRTVALGYDGKWAVHPGQVEVINEAYSPPQDRFDQAVALLDAYETATVREHRGAVMLADAMIDEASAKIARKVVQRGRRAGFRSSGRD